MDSHSEVCADCLVVGGGICGILTAASIAPLFSKVLLLEKDKVHTGLHADKVVAKRSGVLQWQHPHVLAAGGLQKIELLLPGFTACCKEQGAYIMGEDGHINETMMQAWLGRSPVAPGSFDDPRFVFNLGTRSLMERCARYMLLLHHSNVEFRSGCKVKQVLWDKSVAAVIGVQLQSGEEIYASLVIEATGASSRTATEFLRDIGRGECRIISVDPGLNYFTRFFRVPEQIQQLPRQETCQMAYHMPIPPDSIGRLFMRVEDNLYQANISMLNKQKCGSDVEDFLKYFDVPYAPGTVFHEALQGLEPVGPMISWLGYPGTVKRCLEQLNMPDGYLVLGDALASLNPRFGTGISTAALQAEMLGKLMHTKCQFQAGTQPCKLSKADLRGLSDKAQKQAARIVDFALGMVTYGDMQFDFTNGFRTRNPVMRLVYTYMDWTTQLTATDLAVARTFLLTASFRVPQIEIFKPTLAAKILAYGASVTWAGMGFKLVADTMIHALTRVAEGFNVEAFCYFRVVQSL